MSNSYLLVEVRGPPLREAWQLSGISAICEMRLKLGAGGAAGGGLAEGFDAVGCGDAGDEARGVGDDDGDRAVEVQ